MDLDTARSAYLAAAEAVHDAASEVRLTRDTPSYRDAVANLEQAHARQVDAHRQLRDATAGHTIDPAVIGRLDQDGAALAADLERVRAHLAGLAPDTA